MHQLTTIDSLRAQLASNSAELAAASAAAASVRSSLTAANARCDDLRRQLQSSRAAAAAATAAPPPPRPHPAVTVVTALSLPLAALVWSATHASDLDLSQAPADASGSLLATLPALLHAMAPAEHDTLPGAALASLITAAAAAESGAAPARARPAAMTTMPGCTALTADRSCRDPGRESGVDALRMVLVAEAVLGALGNSASRPTGRLAILESDGVVDALTAMLLALVDATEAMLTASPGPSSSTGLHLSAQIELASRLVTLVLIAMFNISLGQRGARELVAREPDTRSALCWIARSWPSDDIRVKAVHLLSSFLEFKAFTLASEPEHASARAFFAGLAADDNDTIRNTAHAILSHLHAKPAPSK